MRIPYFEVHAFTSQPFGGNPAGVCLLEGSLPDSLLQKIAAESNLPETAFVIPEGDGFRLRWFSPAAEVDLCGHATLAAAHVLFTECRFEGDAVAFETKSGELAATRRGEHIELNFPARPPEACAVPDELQSALGIPPRQILRSRDYLAIYDTEDEVASLVPDMDAIAALDCLGVIATAPGKESDFVSRFFAPSIGVPEDPVTGSAHCTLIPYWAERLERAQLFARQISVRGGELHCRMLGQRVGIGGAAITFLRGELNVPQERGE